MKRRHYRYLTVGLVSLGLLGVVALALPAISLGDENVETPSIPVKPEIGASGASTGAEEGPPTELTTEHEIPMAVPEVRGKGLDVKPMTLPAPDLTEIIAEHDERSALSF